jgi:hypothetical protein
VDDDLVADCHVGDLVAPAAHAIGLAKSLLSHNEGMHARRHVPETPLIAEIEQSDMSPL